MKLVLFDIDGTLLSAGGASKQAYSRAFEKIYGIKDAFRNVQFHGRTDPLILQELAEIHFGRYFTESECHKVYELFYTTFEEEIANPAHQFEIMRGALELCKELKNREDVVLGLETGNLEKVAFMKLQRAELDTFFSFGGFCSDHADRAAFIALAIERAASHSNGRVFKPHEVTVIGDAVQDVRAAKQNGCKMIGVATGGYTADQLRSAGADLVVDSLLEREEILKIIEK